MSGSILNGQVRKCAQCGKEFRVYGLVNMWAYKKHIKEKYIICARINVMKDG